MLAQREITPKDPTDTDLYIIDFKLVVLSPDYIVSVTSDATPAGSTSEPGLTIVSTSQVGTQIQIEISGGSAGVVYALGAKVTCNSGRVLHRSIPVPVKAR